MQTLEFPWAARSCLQDTKRLHRGKGRKGETHREEGEEEETMHSRRNTMRKGEGKRKRKSYLRNSIRLHRPSSVRRFAFVFDLLRWRGSRGPFARSLWSSSARPRVAGFCRYVLFPFSQIMARDADKSASNSTWMNNIRDKGNLNCH